MSALKGPLIRLILTIALMNTVMSISTVAICTIVVLLGLGFKLA